MLADARYQRELPAVTHPEEAEHGNSGFPSLPAAVNLPVSGISALMKALLWGLLGAAVVLLLVWLVRYFAERRPRPKRPEPASTPEVSTASAAAAPLPGDPAALAAAGRYDEAVHALLLAALALLSRRLRLPLPPSRTSREALRALPLSGAPREAFAGLVGTVERSWFGGSAVDAEDYRVSLARFQLLAGQAAAPSQPGPAGETGAGRQP